MQNSTFTEKELDGLKAAISSDSTSVNETMNRFVETYGLIGNTTQLTEAKLIVEGLDAVLRHGEPESEYWKKCLQYIVNIPNSIVLEVETHAYRLIAYTIFLSEGNLQEAAIKKLRFVISDDAHFKNPTHKSHLLQHFFLYSVSPDGDCGFRNIRIEENPASALVKEVKKEFYKTIQALLEKKEFESLIFAYEGLVRGEGVILLDQAEDLFLEAVAAVVPSFPDEAKEYLFFICDAAARCDWEKGPTEQNFQLQSLIHRAIPIVDKTDSEIINYALRAFIGTHTFAPIMPEIQSRIDSFKPRKGVR